MSKRTVLITGCSSGFGLGLAQAFHARGWQVVAGLRDLDHAPHELGEMKLVQLNLEDNEQIVSISSGIDRLDCLINNAGYALTGPLASYEASQMRRQMQVNILGPALLTQKLLPALKSCGGRIICVSSIAGEMGMPMNAMYCAAKHAVEGFAESLRHELVSHGVQVALVEPGGFRTRFAANMEWGALASPLDSIDLEQLTAYRAVGKKIMAKPGRDSNTVVTAIIRLAEMKTMPIRTRVGVDARLLRSVKRWLPESWATNVIGSIFRWKLSKKKGSHEPIA